MSPHTLATRVVGWQVTFSAISALALHFLLPVFLLLPEKEGKMAALSLSLAVLIAGSLSIAQGWSLVWARRKLLEGLTGDLEHSDNQIDLPKLNDDPWHIVNAWLYMSVGAVALSMTALRPDVIPPSNALTLGLFASVILAAASLPLLMLVRRDFVRLMERVPPSVMGEVIDAQIRSGRLRGRTSRRLLAAIATPVAFLAVGSALIAGAHVRSLEETERQATARAVVNTVFRPATDTDRLSEDGIPGGLGALGALSESGYRVRLRNQSLESETIETRHGVVDMDVPIAKTSAQILFYGTSGWAISWRALPIAVIALIASSWVGIALARLLSRDLRMANHGVRMLGTDAALEGTRVMRPARFRAVAELGGAIELLASRFRLFAQAQETSISARETATRARGRFFASVSHDLKSPLNAILGFAELTHRDPLTNDAQRESLDAILDGGRELLSLIETILDAARVEAGQLHLEIQDDTVEAMLERALDKAKDLTVHADVLARFDIPPDMPPLPIDPMRFSSAMATFLGHARRTAERSSMRVLVEADPRPDRPSLKKRKVTFHIEIPSTQFTANELEGMLNPEQQPGQHRGLSLALRLAKSVIEMHGGTVVVTGRTVSEPAFAIQVRGRPGK